MLSDGNPSVSRGIFKELELINFHFYFRKNILLGVYRFNKMDTVFVTEE